ncbi:interferon-induced protein 35 [Lampris incognitus]|uniref:interferon-induced protein 35 n=1 Tax=Lampris incognitus TaxID=2546036 RepID=UPI0024B4E2CE|nr:interferon-induced protein 35 [Lampris incognitus]XP_056143743.1 interferon-induced protein 35 [Lampris incognitus]
MSSEEDFAVLVKDEQWGTLEEITKATITLQKQYDQLISEHNELCKLRDEQRDLAEQFRQRSEKLAVSLEEDKRDRDTKSEAQKVRRDCLLEEEVQLQKEIQMVEVALGEQEVEYGHLKQQTELSAAVPERKVVFNGLTEDIASAQMFAMRSRIVYPMEGGTVLVTFEDQTVAEKILAMKQHTVCLGGDCRIIVEAKPVQLLVPSFVEMDTQVCPHRILISSLPKKDSDRILDKLEIHFSKKQHGGGEVEECDTLHDPGNVVITFMEDNVARRLTDQQYHDVSFEKGSKHRVRVTPFLNGGIVNFKTEFAACARTLLLTGLHDVMDPETLQDLLEIHFQKAINGGGEVEAFLYNPPGERFSAVFEDEQPAAGSVSAQTST